MKPEAMILVGDVADPAFALAETCPPHDLTPHWGP